MSIRRFRLHLSLMLVACLYPATHAGTLDLGTGKLIINDRGTVTQLTFADGAQWPSSCEPAFWIEAGGKTYPPEALEQHNGQWRIRFENGATAEFSVTTGRGFAVFRLTKLVSQEPVTGFRLFNLAAPVGARVARTLNGAMHEGRFGAVMVAEPNVRLVFARSGGSKSDRQGCSHEFVRVDDAKVGSHAARFTATSDAKPGGWSMRGKSLPVPRDLTGCKAIRAWVHGDGKGQVLKIQLFDGAGGHRDDYLTIDFTGWRQVTLTAPTVNTLKYDHVAGINVYYNRLPPGQTVNCLIDHVEAILERDGKQTVELLEDFEAADSPVWWPPVYVLGVETASNHGLEPAAFGVIACPEAERLDVIEQFELAAGLPCPRPGGMWNKKSPWIKRSYFFLTDFSESQFDEAVAIAKRGGFHMILLGQESWSLGTGHYQINRDRFPDGLEGLKRTCDRFRDAGFRVGLHFLSASIYPPDPYLVPVPDPRLVKGATATLAADIDAEAQFLPIETPPDTFPNEDEGERIPGTVLQVGNELIWCGRSSMQAPYGFAECRRGYLGTKAAAHKKGDRVSHLVRRGYSAYMFDMDTTLLDEVSSHFAKVVNTCNVDMIYFDGAERLQGDHWYYNAKLIKAFFDKLANKDILLQASSFSPYSWHILARGASADGHGDLKGYLDERSPRFQWLADDAMPLDIGWYYGYDPMCTPDQYEYILGATIGYDSSMSFQVSCSAAARHPFTGEILDLINRYEKLRLSGRVPAEMRNRLRIDPSLGGMKEPEERTKLLDRRREYRLLGVEGRQYFQRVVYQPWHEVKSTEAGPADWTVRINEPQTRIGVQIHAMSGPWLDAGPAYRAAEALLLESFDDLASYTHDPKNRRDVRVIEHGQFGLTSTGVTHRFEIREDSPREGKRYALYTAESTHAGGGGWSMVRKTFDPPLDLSWHKGIGFWLRGDGRGGVFKFQLTDGRRGFDYIVTNDFTGWRYLQIARPDKDPMDYSKVRALMFYYNGLPGKTAVACGIDDVKALRSLDEPTIANPYVEIGDLRWEFSSDLRAGQYVFFWPGEPITRYGLPLKQPEIFREQADSVVLPPGEYHVHLGCRGTLTLPVRVRITLQPPERHEIP